VKGPLKGKSIMFDGQHLTLGSAKQLSNHIEIQAPGVEPIHFQVFYD
jgi:hypothetical protein